MRTTLLSAAALVATALSAQAADPDYASNRITSAHDWTGFYVGGSLGHAKAADEDEEFPIAPGFTIELYSEGASDNYGFHAGYMQQFGGFVVGGEYEYLNLDIQYVGENIGPIPVFLEEGHIVKGRLGLAADKFLFYGTAGMIYASTNVDLADWTPIVGVGLDIAVNDNIILGAQYAHSWFDEFDDRPIAGTLDHYALRLSFQF